MPGSDPTTGDVYYYPYVWKRQLGGLAEPEKDRPCCVAIRLRDSRLRGADTFLLAISQSGVPEGGYGCEIPPELVRRLNKLDVSAPTHIVLSEFNADLAEHPAFDDCEYLGTLPGDFMKSVLQQVKDHLLSGSGGVARTG